MDLDTVTRSKLAENKAIGDFCCSNPLCIGTDRAQMSHRLWHFVQNKWLDLLFSKNRSEIQDIQKKKDDNIYLQIDLSSEKE